MFILCRTLWFIGIFASSGRTERNLKQDVKEAIGTTIFESIDHDSDGVIESNEIAKEITSLKGKEIVTLDAEGIKKGVKSAIKGLDLNKDRRISEEDFYHPNRPSIVPLLTPAGVADWVKYAVQLPEYAKRFEDNTVNWLDFSVLMQDDGEALKNNIGIKSLLHRQKLIKSMKIVMLGIAEAPLEPSTVCKSATCNGLNLKWKANPGKRLFPVHSYRLQMVVDDDDDEDMDDWETVYNGSKTHYEITKLKASTKYQFRVQAWNQIGHSPFTEFHCKTKRVCAEKKTGEASFFDWLWSILETIFFWTLLLVSGAATYHGAQYFFPKVVKKVPKKPQLPRIRSRDAMRPASRPSGQRPPVHTPRDSAEQLPGADAAAPAPLTRIPRSSSGRSVDAPDPLPGGDGENHPWQILSIKKEMDKQEFADQDFKERIVWVEINESSLLNTCLKWSKTQRQKSTIFGKKKKKVLLKSVFDILRLDESTLKIRYKGLFSAAVSLTLRINDEAATDWFDAFESLHDEVIALAEEKR